MKSGLEGRNNKASRVAVDAVVAVSMKSGLEGRNNRPVLEAQGRSNSRVSMKSGLEGRNNQRAGEDRRPGCRCLNEVRPRRPEQCETCAEACRVGYTVSMKSGLEGRNNHV